MDSLTQAALGAAIGESMLGRKIGGKAALIGAALATIPDLDVVLYLFYDKLEMLSIHRGFSHSLVFSLLGGVLLAFILSRLRWLASIGFKRLFLFSWLCLFTHQLLDTFTAYGTQLFLPFSDARLGLDSINVVDPLYTLPLLLGLLLSIWLFPKHPKRSKFNNYGLLVSTLYLLFTLFHKELVKADFSRRFAQQEIQYDALLSMPVGIANINWYGVAKGQDSLWMLQYSLLTKSDSKATSFPINEELLNEIDQHLADKMRWFAKGFYTVDKVDGRIRIYNLQVDMRGITWDGDKKAPTVGYFEVDNQEGKSTFSSGSIGK